ncbi:MAG: hypothetical protein FWF59_15010 [Turicibacter sp.]|nr:hypothetical protein [Turicibacter sp.]
MKSERSFFEGLLKYVVVCGVIFVGMRGLNASANGLAGLQSNAQPVHAEITSRSTWGFVERQNRWVGRVLNSRSFVHGSGTGHSLNVTVRAWLVDVTMVPARQTRINQATATNRGWAEVHTIWTDDFLNIFDARGNWE